MYSNGYTRHRLIIVPNFQKNISRHHFFKLDQLFFCQKNEKLNIFKFHSIPRSGKPLQIVYDESKLLFLKMFEKFIVSTVFSPQVPLIWIKLFIINLHSLKLDGKLTKEPWSN
jgi:hypothetical protein